MSKYVLIDRPPVNRRHLTEKDLDWDTDLEVALRATAHLENKAVIVPLARFHSSPAKGRIWKDGLKVKHRVLADRNTVAAWVE